MVRSDIVERPRPGSLPAEMTSLVGRRHEIAEVKRLMSRSRVVTLTGSGGVGKSRLALRVAREVRRAFCDGVWLVELAALEKPEFVVQAISEAVDIRNRSSRPPIEALAGFLRDATALLVLDNCEHLLPECAVVVETLLRAAPNLRVLATSRQSLGIIGEQTLPVPTLSLPGPDRPTTQSPLRYDAITLFAERAAAAVPGFAVTENNQDAVENICRRLDGIPLAIELAAVRLRALAPEQLADRLGDRFRLLTAGSPGSPHRQRTLRALVDWSHTLCTEQERLLWARLSVFAGGFDLEAAENVCSGDGIGREDVLDLIIRLVDKSILIREEEPAVRYRLLETIRQYGQDRLCESAEEPRFRRRHRDWYRDLAVRSNRAWFGPEQITWFKRLRGEHANIRTALDFCLTRPGEAAEGVSIATALEHYWGTAFLNEGRRWLDRLLALDSVPMVRRAWMLTLNAQLAALQSDFPRAVPMLEEARRLADRCDDPTVTAKVVYVSGMSALFQSDLAGAATLLEEATERFRELNDEIGELHAVPHLAGAYSSLGRSAEAAGMFQRCLEQAEAIGDHSLTSHLLYLSAIEVRTQGDRVRAAEMLRRSVRLKQALNDRPGITRCIEAMAWIAADARDPQRAARLLGALQRIWRSLCNPPFPCMVAAHDECESAVLRQLGADRFDVVARAGAELTVDQALALAFDETTPAGEPLEAPSERSPLTPRERDVARLIAEGMTNKEIAASLVIAQRTAEGHVEHILTKLGFTSRTQIAVWMGAEQEPAGRR